MTTATMIQQQGDAKAIPSQSRIYGMNKHVLFLLLAILSYITLVIVMVAIKIKTTYLKVLLPPVYEHTLFLLLIGTYLYLVDFIINAFNRNFKKRPNSFNRYFLEIAVIAFTGYFTLKAFTLIYLWAYSFYNSEPALIMPQIQFSQIVLLNFLMIVYAFMRGFHFFISLRQKDLELVQWHKEVSQSHFDSLKNQLNPHFLFNSFSILISLIHKDANEADIFINKLSKAYRYLLDQRDKETVCLSVELDFLKNYDYILTKRFGSKIQLEYTNAFSTEYNVIPYTFILLIDHIIATNKMSILHPLKITISVSDQQLCISHHHIPKPNQVIQEQLLLLQERYEMLTRQTITITKNAGVQQICIPLLPVTHEATVTI